MPQKNLTEAVENLDQRLARVEQILPTLATKEDLRLLATKEELKPLATKEELKAEGEATRRYMKILFEDLKSTINLYAERLTAVDERDVRQHAGA